MLRTFLDHPPVRRARTRAFLTSVAAHAALGLFLLFWAPPSMPPSAPLAMALPISLTEAPPVEEPGGGSAAAAAPRPVAPVPRRRAAPAPVAVAVEEPVPAADGEVEVPEVAEEVEPAAAPPAATGIAGEGAGSGTGDGVGSGTGPGEGFGLGGRAFRRKREELAGRVIPDEGFRGPERDVPTVSRHEATTLRTYDFFPRLPAALWQSDRAYVVVVDVCVSEDGQVSDAALLAHRSPHLDTVVLEAVRTWRYRPRVVDGRPGAFCHVVTIKYDRL